MIAGSVYERAQSYKIPGVLVDGQDVIAVYDAAMQAVQRARSGHGPSLIETDEVSLEKGIVMTGNNIKSLYRIGGVSALVQLAAPGEGFYVTGEQGPLKDGELDRAADWAGRLTKKEGE